ncbi:leucine-rich repeat-containing protein [Cavenderia fasciculata]|uniref:Leucine-rich repeat-containing protein n=1 Tax=Cavenderia fasciculata TaxID=261658 RepID=F4PWJ0_CACFS|nr:leucine-rich repeat-containing protein [Cavenderia fasciculata]EGG20354.1 leucine-rich repeat-containing protein [Cavenderia fasciculata]|eukprot:XP_004367337.1 leucine-rich repeat-containing protein [Cavenderia fasciculata]
MSSTEFDKRDLLKRSGSVLGGGSNSNLLVVSKNSPKVPGRDTKYDERTLTKPPLADGGESKLADFTVKDSRTFFATKSYPIFFDASDANYNLESDEFLKSCPNILKSLNLTSNSLIEFSSASHLTKLKWLILEKNNLVDISIQSLTALVYLSVANNRLAHVPITTDLKKIVHLDLSFNRLIDGFEELSKLKTLKVLDLSNNNINIPLDQFNKEVLGSLKKVKTLEYFSLQGNPIDRNIQEFRCFVANELKSIKYYNWSLVTKDERSKGGKLESENFWASVMTTQFQISTIFNNAGSALNLKSSQGGAAAGEEETERTPYKSPILLSKVSQSPLLKKIVSSSNGSGLNSSTEDFSPSSSLSSSGGFGTPSKLESVPLRRKLSFTGSSDQAFSKTGGPVQEDSFTSKSSGTSTPSTSKLDLDPSVQVVVVNKRSSNDNLSPISLQPTSPPLQMYIEPIDPLAGRDDQSMSAYLDLLLEELGPINLEVGPNVHHSTYLDMLYRAIVDDVMMPELLLADVPSQVSSDIPSHVSSSQPMPISQAPIIRMSEDEIIKPVEEVSTAAPPQFPTTAHSPSVATSSPRKTSQWVKVSDQQEKMFGGMDVIIKKDATPAVTTTTTTTSTTIATEPKPISSSPIISSSKPAAASSPSISTPKPVAVLKKSPALSSSPSSGSPMMSSSPKPTGAAAGSPNPFGVVLKKAPAPASGSPASGPSPVSPISPNVTSPPAAASPPGSPLIRKVPVAKNPVPPSPSTLSTIISKPPQSKPSPPTQSPLAKPPGSVAPPVAAAAPVAPPSTSTDFDVDTFKDDIEKTLRDIENTYNNNQLSQPTSPVVAAKPAAATAAATPVTVPVVKKATAADFDILDDLSNAIKQDEQSTSTARPKLSHVDSRQNLLKEISQKDVTMKLDQVSSATQKLNEMIEEYNQTKDKVVDDNLLKLDKLLNTFEQTTQLQQNTYSMTPPTDTLSPKLTHRLSTYNVPRPSSQPSWICNYSDVQVNAKLGTGSWGDCYLGSVWQKTVVFKKLRIQRFSDQFIDAFKEEVDKLRQLGPHDNVVPVIGGCADTNIMAISPHVEAVTLQQIIAETPASVTPDFIVAIAAGVARAMCYLHQFNIIHRTLKPSNILLDTEGRVMIRDYGFTAIKDNLYKSSATHGGAVNYFAPEIFESGASNYDQNIDQYAFGLILWEMFTHQNAFPSSVAQHQIPDLLKQGYRPEVPSQFPMVFDRLIRACWNQDPSARPNFLTISKILSQPTQRLFANQISMTLPIPITDNHGSLPTSQKPIYPHHQQTSTPTTASPPTSSPTITSQQNNSNNNSTTNIKSELERKMKLVTEKVMLMIKNGGERVMMDKAFKALENLAANEENAETFIGCGLVPLLIQSFAQHIHYQDSILSSLNQLCLNVSLCAEFVHNGGLTQLVRLMNSSSINTSILACKLLTTVADEEYLRAIRDSGALKVLFVTLQSTNELLQMQTVWALSRALLDVGNQQYFIACGGIPILLGMVSSTRQGLSVRALISLCCLITNPQCQQQLVNAGVLSRLIESIDRSPKLLKIPTIRIIGNIVDKEQKVDANQHSLRDLVIQNNFIHVLIDQIQTTDDQDLIDVATSCLVPILQNDPNAHQLFYQLHGVDKILLHFNVNSQSNEILVNILTIFTLIINHDLSRLKLRFSIIKLVELLNNGNVGDVDSLVVIKALQCLTIFATHVSCVPMILESNATASVKALLVSPTNQDVDIKISTIRLISSLSKTGNYFINAIIQSGIVAALLDNIRDHGSSSLVKDESIASVAWLSASAECRQLFMEKNVFHRLLEYTQANINRLTNYLKESLLWAISFFALDATCQTLICQVQGTLEFVVSNLLTDAQISGEEGQVCRMLAIKTVLILSQKQVNHRFLKQTNIIDSLTNLTDHTSTDNQSIQIASKKIIQLLQ